MSEDIQIRQIKDTNGDRFLILYIGEDPQMAFEISRELTAEEVKGMETLIMKMLRDYPAILHRIQCRNV